MDKLSRRRLTERDIRLLGIFYKVAEAGGLSAAEAKLGMERSTISRHVQALEERMGGSLCDRGPIRGFHLTELGKKVFRAAAASKDAFQRAEVELAQALDTLTGTVSLGVADNTITNPTCNLVAAIEQLRSKAPEIETTISIAPPIEVVDDIVHRRLDLALLAKPSARFRLAAEPLFEEHFRLYVREMNGSVKIADLSRHGLAIAMRSEHWQSEKLASELDLPHFGFARGLEAMATLIATGGYVGFLPTHLANALHSCYALVEVEGAEYLRYRKTFCLVYDPTRSLSPAVETFVDLIRSTHSSNVRATQS